MGEYVGKRLMYEWTSRVGWVGGWVNHFPHPPTLFINQGMLLRARRMKGTGKKLPTQAKAKVWSGGMPIQRPTGTPPRSSTTGKALITCFCGLWFEGVVGGLVFLGGGEGVHEYGWDK